MTRYASYLIGLMAALSMCAALVAEIGGRSDICPAAPKFSRPCVGPTLPLAIQLPDIPIRGSNGGHVILPYRLSGTTTPAPERGSFRLSGMPLPEPLLDCGRILQEVVRLQQIGGGAVKQVYFGTWGHSRLPVAISLPQLYDGVATYLSDFQHGSSMLELLDPHPRLVQLVGTCHDHANGPVVVTEYHRRSSADTLMHHLAEDPALDTTAVRFRLCLDYAEILAMLHSFRLVMCDSSTLSATLRQYLLTDDLRLMLNDVDALPVAAGSGVLCGSRPLYGDFVAPEQRSDADGGLPEPYDQQTDIWKVPAVCEHFLGAGSPPELTFRLFALHRRCRAHQPDDRPTAAEVLETYTIVWQELFSAED